MDYVLIWSFLIPLALLIYMIFDGFDLGVGILFPFAKNEEERSLMMGSIAPVWDSNETWLILAGGGLYALFPKAYAFIFPVLYGPVILMLLCLAFRGVAFEFRARASKSKILWNWSFFIGSFGSAYFQGVIAGSLLWGFQADDNGNFIGSLTDWFSPFPLLMGVGVVLGYSLLGATFLVYKLDDNSHFIKITRRLGKLLFLGFIVSCAIYIYAIAEEYNFPFVQFPMKAHILGVVHDAVVPITFGLIVVFSLFVQLLLSVRKDRLVHDIRPFLFLSGLMSIIFVIGTALVWPYAVPGVYDIWEAASSDKTLQFVLVGSLIFLPLILAYSAYNFWVFRGKVNSSGY